MIHDPRFDIARLDVDATVTAIHEAGHAVARHIVHGTTGAIRWKPESGREAGAESEPLPDHLVENRGSGLPARLADGPFRHESDRFRLEQEIKTTLAGSIAEAAVRGTQPDVVLSELAQDSDFEYSAGIANKLWAETGERERNLERITAETSSEILKYWPAVSRVADAFDERDLTADDVASAIRDAKD